MRPSTCATRSLMVMGNFNLTNAPLGVSEMVND
jgi:hypothetical protein